MPNAAFRALVAADIPTLLGNLDVGQSVRANGRTVVGLVTTRNVLDVDGAGLPVQVERTVLQVPAGTLGKLPMGTLVTVDGTRYEIRGPLASEGDTDTLIDEWQVAAR